MSYFLQYREIYDHPLMLSETELQDPVLALLTIFSDNSLSEIRDQLAMVVEVCVTTANEQFKEAESRYKLVSTQRALERLAEAAMVLPRARLVPDEYDLLMR